MDLQIPDSRFLHRSGIWNQDLATNFVLVEMQRGSIFMRRVFEKIKVSPPAPSLVLEIKIVAPISTFALGKSSGENAGP